MASLIPSTSSLVVAARPTRHSSAIFTTSHSLHSIPLQAFTPSARLSEGLYRFRCSCAQTRTPKLDDFMTKRENLLVVKPTTTVDEALELLVENKITGFPVIEDDGKLVGIVSDYDFLAVADWVPAGSGTWFPEVDSYWETFNMMRKLGEKSNGKVVGEVMTAAPLVVGETTKIEDAARLLLETKFDRLPVVDVVGRLVGIITREDVVRAAVLAGDRTCQLKKAAQN